jgi:hypothetical protein
MRLTYTVAAIIVGAAIVVAYRFLPARPATIPGAAGASAGAVSGGETAFDGLSFGFDHAAD